MTESEHVGELVDRVAIDPLRKAFAAAIAALMEALPSGYARDTAVEQIMEAHRRTEHALRRNQVLH